MACPLICDERRVSRIVARTSLAVPVVRKQLMECADIVRRMVKSRALTRRMLRFRDTGSDILLPAALVELPSSRPELVTYGSLPAWPDAAGAETNTTAHPGRTQ